MEIFIFLQSFFIYLIDFFKFIYLHFSFPLLLLVFCFLFRKEIIKLFANVSSINYKNGELQVDFKQLSYVTLKMKESENEIIKEEGPSVTDPPSLGGNEGRLNNPEYNKAYNLIHSSDTLYKNIQRNGRIQTIYDLFDSYKKIKENKNHLNKNYTIKEKYDEIIEGYFKIVKDIDEHGGTITEKEVFQYKDFIYIVLKPYYYSGKIEDKQ